MRRHKNVELKNVFELNKYQFKTSRYRSIYINFMVTTNKKSKRDTKKSKRNEYKYIPINNHFKFVWTKCSSQKT